MRITVKTISNKSFDIDLITELCFTQTAGVACDSLWFKFRKKADMEEIVTVKAYNGETLIFNGICDCQKIYHNKDGFECYVFARSTAALLVDNEAEPFTYNCPTAKGLCFSLAKDLGFKDSLPDISSRDKYEVSKGMSLYGAISQFVLLKTGRRIYISPENEIRCFEKSDKVKSLNAYRILSLMSIINRGEPISKIIFKKSNSQSGYCLNTAAKISDDLGIKRVQYINLLSIPMWQREYAVLQRLKSSYENYKVLEAMAAGYIGDSLYSRFDCELDGMIYDDYFLTEKKYICDSKGERTVLVLKKQIDIKEVTYVD